MGGLCQMAHTGCPRWVAFFLNLSKRLPYIVHCSGWLQGEHILLKLLEELGADLSGMRSRGGRSSFG
jgi:hypothetical protein